MSDKYKTISSLVYGAGGKFCSVKFTKKDGSSRLMNIQPAAIKNHLVGDAASESAKKATETRKQNNPNLLPVYDVQKHEIRSINMDTVTEVKVGKQVFNF